jgi:hypothetical protein
VQHVRRQEECDQSDAERMGVDGQQQRRPAPDGPRRPWIPGTALWIGIDLRFAFPRLRFRRSLLT